MNSIQLVILLTASGIVASACFSVWKSSRDISKLSPTKTEPNDPTSPSYFAARIKSRIHKQKLEAQVQELHRRLDLARGILAERAFETLALREGWTVQMRECETCKKPFTARIGSERRICPDCKILKLLEVLQQAER